MHCNFFLVVSVLLVISVDQNAALVHTALSIIDLMSESVTSCLDAKRNSTTTDTIYKMENILNLVNETVTNELVSEVNVIENLVLNNDLEQYLSTQEYSKQYDEIYDYFDRIEFLYDKTKEWTSHFKENEMSDLHNQTKLMISLVYDYPKSILFEMHRKICPPGKLSDLNFLENYHGRFQFSNDTCDNGLLPHYHLFEFYNQIIKTELQGFATMAFSYMWRFKKYGINYTDEINMVKNQRIQNIIDYTNLFKNKMQITKNFVKRCAAKYRENENIIGNKTYASFENFIYAFPLVLRDVYPECEHNGIPSGKKLCDIYGNCNDNNDYDKICPGWIHGCEYIPAESVELCQLEQPNQSSTKHYNHWMRIYKDDKVLNIGDTNRPCPSIRGINGVITPTLCFGQILICYCVDKTIHSKSDTIRAFSLLWSQTSDDMVATGARLVAKDRMIHIQLREGKLLPYGRIDKETERWVPLPSFKYNNSFPIEAIYPNGTTYSLEEDKDFITLHSYYSKDICLQKLTFNEKHLLTGVRFDYEYLGEGLEKRFKLEAKYVGFDYQLGKITTGTKYHKQSCIQLPELILNNPDDPLKFEKHEHDSVENQFIAIRTTDLVKDAGQTTIPYFDLLEVTTNPNIPLTGIELFHKGKSDGTSGGYVALKIYPMNLTTYMDG